MFETPLHDRQVTPIVDESLAGLIGKQVMNSLGTPTDFLKVRVHPIGSDRYRVNVLAGASFAMARVANSFFVRTDEEGDIVTSRPAINRLY